MNIIILIIAYIFWFAQIFWMIFSFVQKSKQKKRERFYNEGYKKVSEITVFDVADYFEFFCGNSGTRAFLLNRIDLYIYTYLVQGYHLGYTGKPLFDEKVIVMYDSFVVKGLNEKYSKTKDFFYTTRTPHKYFKSNKFNDKQIKIMKTVWQSIIYFYDAKTTNLMIGGAIAIGHKNMSELQKELVLKLFTHDPLGKAHDKLTAWKQESDVLVEDMEEFYLTRVMLKALDVPENDEEEIKDAEVLS